MKEKIKEHKFSLTKFFTISVIFILLAVVIEGAMSIYVLKNDLAESTELFLNQIQSVLENNEKEMNQQVEEIKEKQIVTARAAAYIVENRGIIRNNVTEARYVARLLSVDELHIFDENGTIIAGTNPEYFGYSFDSGEQIAYFKPMLDDRTLSMCQDVTPNTAKGKKMMYAIAWNSRGQFMVQTGVEPLRLIEMLKGHEEQAVVNNIPVTEGYDIYLVDADTNTICASSDKELVDKNLTDDLGLDISSDRLLSPNFRYLNGEWYYTNTRLVDKYIIGVSYKLSKSNNSLLFPLIIILAYLFISTSIIGGTIYKSRVTEHKKNEAIMNQYKLLSSMLDIYYSMHLIDIENNTFTEYKSQGTVKELSTDATDPADLMKKIMSTVVTDEYVEKALQFTDINTVSERIGKKKSISADFIGKNIGWFQGMFIVVERNEEGKASKIIWTVRSIEKLKKREEKLILKSNTDELTECYNRHAYEDGIKEMKKLGIGEDFVYLSVDVNGLKQINDNLGHEAGDELIVGAANCLKEALSEYGKIFRIGGDEFVAFINHGDNNLSDILKKLDSVVSKWRGNLVEELSISYGYVKRSENPRLSLQKMATMADHKMYEAKSMHYRSIGVDRRGQQDAHKVLYDSYTKILKVNLSEDSYQIINMDSSEQTEEKGFSDKISVWLASFGKSGQVHPEDLEDYLRYTDLEYIKDYFSKDKTSLHIFYRRQYEDGYKNSMLELIPASEYSDENQIVFLYVKNIDK